ncbi:MAG: gamma-glutamyl-gamma-aminobutyrate hydrolase family protein [Hyphomicrobiales bacterium]
MSAAKMPVVLVTADVKPLENYRWHATPSTYLNALVAGAGAVPLILPDFADRLDLDAALDRVDGVLATGSRSNVHPSRYGVAPSERHEPYDEARDATTLPLILRALERGIPTFCVCRGYQELNVALGGTLATEIQDLPGRMDHRAPVSDVQDERFAIRHPVEIVPGGVLAGIFDSPSIAVNSLHRQAIDRLADRLVVEGRAPDGTIEAVRVADARGWNLGVQWHPEYWVGTDPVSDRLFAAFGEAVRAG